MKMIGRPDVVTRDTVLSFGKHKGWTIGECVEADPDYVVWLSEDEVMNIPMDILEEAQENVLVDSEYDYGIDDPFSWEWDDD